MGLAASRVPQVSRQKMIMFKWQTLVLEPGFSHVYVRMHTIIHMRMYTYTCQVDGISVGELTTVNQLLDPTKLQRALNQSTYSLGCG